MKNWKIFTVLILLALVTACKREGKTEMTPEKKVKWEAPTQEPTMTLLMGTVLLVDLPGKETFTRDSVNRGTSYIVGQYQGKQDIENISSLVLMHPHDLVPIPDMNFFQKLDKANTGVISADVLREAHVALGHYNAQGGYLEVKTPVSLQIENVRYYPGKNRVEFLKQDGRVELAGKFVEFKR